MFWLAVLTGVCNGLVFWARDKEARDAYQSQQRPPADVP
jgi:hypothetical protein